MKIAVIGGDGTGPEVTARSPQGPRGRRQTRRLRLRDSPTSTIGGDRYLQHRRDPARGRGRELAASSTPSTWAPSAIPTWPPASSRRACCCELRFQLDQYINLRPVQALSRRRNAAGRQGARGHRLRRRPREHRRHVLRRRRLPQEGHARRSRHADRHLHPQGLRALHPLGLRVHPQAQQPQGQDAHAGRQDQRADLRPRPLVADVPGRGQGISRTSKPTTTTSTPAACGWSRTPSTTT